MKGFFRFVLRAVGILAILIGVFWYFVLSAEPDKVGSALGIFALAVVVFGALGFGYLMLLFAADLGGEPVDADHRDSLTFWFGIALALLYLGAMAALMPWYGRVIMLVVMLLVLARLNRGWASSRAIGDTTFGDLFDFVAGGIIWLFVDILLAALLGAKIGGFSGGGGAAGGGGASGSW